MRAVLQRVTEASVTIDGQKVGEIGKGIMVLFGMLGTDTDKTIDYMLDKVINFTLYGDARKGRRPGYSSGAAPEIASELFDKLCAKAEALGIKKVQHGIFQTDMKVALVNDGPVTLLLDSEKLF